ncbi:MAG: 1-acyl-sn-glycerol-3-phosphate acyltransferase [Clostridia bacterium]|nr:1-acyl-sn-glycerol-3-phosphate acyltransferase [Clostridia bacterium]
MNKFYRFIKKCGGWIFKLFYRFKIVNPQNEPKDGPFIVCANHTHLFDVVPTVVCLNNQVHFMAKKEVFKTPLLGPFAKAMGAYGVDRGAGDIGAIKKTIEILKNGECICMFPQGTRIPYLDPREVEPKDGVGMISARAGVGVLPVCIRTKKNKLSLFRRTEFVIGEYLTPEMLSFPELNGKEKHKAITDLVYERICELNDQISRKPLSEKKKAKALAKLEKKERKQREKLEKKKSNAERSKKL